ncbi:F-type H+-transporting ATPase subunit b [Roseivivax halotolerans]|uniref:ATP synthase subunit b n=1 Tax=Roseivivax halotolerans TaxID=93684 RepID=A0A1I5Z2I0_9RHOB|nr:MULTISPECIES: F0F1 ATP synthase subunit B [Roseivivax]QFT61534.1 ATP synthase subunit b precursor [Roseivivax sp. THAF30]SFQ50632.1 F-type H+-transporting ATPase subunit b [Roseivivax halotolerans]
MKKLLTLTATASVIATPSFAAGDVFFSLSNTDFVVLLAFLVFLGVLVYFKVPGMLGKMLDDRASGIQSELDEARGIREEAQSLLASYERKQREVQEQADRIVAKAREDAKANAEQAKEDLQRSIERRIAAAEDQIASAESQAVKEVRDRAIVVATAAAREVVAKELGAKDKAKLVDQSIDTVGAKLH